MLNNTRLKFGIAAGLLVLLLLLVLMAPKTSCRNKAAGELKQISIQNKQVVDSSAAALQFSLQQARKENDSLKTAMAGLKTDYEKLRTSLHQKTTEVSRLARKIISTPSTPDIIVSADCDSLAHTALDLVAQTTEAEAARDSIQSVYDAQMMVKDDIIDAQDRHINILSNSFATEQSVTDRLLKQNSQLNKQLRWNKTKSRAASAVALAAVIKLTIDLLKK